MPLTIAVASGKGGTGKTTVSCGLAHIAAREGRSVSLVDCDVEEPNVNLFLKSPIDYRRDVSVLNPVIDQEVCIGCGACGEICQFSAIVVVNKKPILFPDMCHSCGGCCLVCPTDAISEKERTIGILERGDAEGITYTGGLLNISEAKAPPLIEAVAGEEHGGDLALLDAPPGTSCPVIETVRKADFVILVTEPTPFGLNDLTLAVEMVGELDIPFGVVINRSDAGNDCVEVYCRNEEITLLGKIPFSRDVAEAYAEGKVTSVLVEKSGTVLREILEKSSNERRE